MGRIITHIAAVIAALVSASYVGAATVEAAQLNVVHNVRRSVEWQRGRTWHFQDLAGVAHTATAHAERKTTSVPFLRWMESTWNHRRLAAKKLAAHARRRLASASGFPPHHALWLCIHNAPEGAWNDTSPPYAGGLQMSIGWMRMVNNAGYLSQSQQEWLAERAFRANHYSISFLVGQWFKWDGAYYCEKYA